MSFATTVGPLPAGADAPGLEGDEGADGAALLPPPDEQATVRAASPARATTWMTRFISHISLAHATSRVA
jgi:hypothetical protein